MGWKSDLHRQGWQSHHDRTLQIIREGIADPFDGESLIDEITAHTDSDGFDYVRVRKEMEAEVARLRVKKQPHE